MLYEKKTWCLHPSHSSSTRSRRKPSHPKGRRTINAIQADFLNNQISANAERASMIFSAGEKICLRCYKSIVTIFNEQCHSQELDANNDDIVLTRSSSNDSGDCSDPPSFQEQLHNQQGAKEELNSVFQLLKVETVRDE